MMTRWQVFRELRAAMRDPDRIGDVAVYKGELGGARARPEVEARLDAVRGFHPRFDAEALRALPESSFGHQYARFMEAHDLRPIVPTDRPDASMIARNAFTVRYAGIHDMVHVLTGFDTSWPGEIGVWAFVGGQRYSRGFQVAAVVSLLVAPFRCPLQLGRAYRNFRRGWAMGARAKLVIAQRLEDHFETPLLELRAALQVEGADDGYLPASARNAALPAS